MENKTYRVMGRDGMRDLTLPELDGFDEVVKRGGGGAAGDGKLQAEVKPLLEGKVAYLAVKAESKEKLVSAINARANAVRTAGKDDSLTLNRLQTRRNPTTGECVAFVVLARVKPRDKAE